MSGDAQAKLIAVGNLRDTLKHQAKWNSEGGRRWVCVVIAGELDVILGQESAGMPSNVEMLGAARAAFERNHAQET